MTSSTVQPAADNPDYLNSYRTFRPGYSEGPDGTFFSSFQDHFQAFEHINKADVSERKTALETTFGATEVELQNRRELDTQTREQFAKILHEAYSTGAMSAPVAFLQSLSKSDLEVIRRAQSLADSIEVNSLSIEGAYNLLLPGGYKVDFNKDGLSEIGCGKAAFFPPLDAPKAFKIAWLQATQGMAEIDVVVYCISLWSSLHQDQLLNADVDKFRVVRTDLVSTYTTLIRERLKMNEDFKAFLAPGQYERDLAFFDRLRGLLGQTGSPQNALSSVCWLKSCPPDAKVPNTEPAPQDRIGGQV